MTDRRALFPDGHADGMQQRVRAFWNLDYPLPTPHEPIVCKCGGVMVCKQWWFHDRTKTGTSDPWRCDVQTKCIDCSAVTVHGVAVPESMWRKRPRPNPPRDKWIYWRQAKAVLTKAGFFDG